MNEDDSENVYDISIKIITGEIKKKIKYPFRSQNQLQSRNLKYNSYFKNDYLEKNLNSC